MINTFVFARALHILAVVFWIGGVALVTVVILPELKKSEKWPIRRMVLFKNFEKRFSLPVKFAVIITGASGLYMVEVLNYWSRIFDPNYWWLQAMIWLWLVFALVLFVVEPFLLKRILGPRLKKDPEKLYQLIGTVHWLLFILSMLVIGAAVAGSHGGILN